MWNHKSQALEEKCLNNYVLNMTTKVQTEKTKRGNWDFIELKSLWTANGKNSSMKRQSRLGKNIHKLPIGWGIKNDSSVKKYVIIKNCKGLV